jgi:HEAT repeat protein
MRAGARLVVLFFLLCTSSHAQVTNPTPPSPPGSGSGKVHPGGPPRGRFPRREAPLPPLPPLLPVSQSFREHFGLELASRLLRARDPDERLRGVERAAAIGTPETASLLIHAAKDLEHPFGADTRALLTIVRGLSEATGQSEVRSFLKDGVLGATFHKRAATASADPEPEVLDRDARLLLARSEAAFALATSADPKAVEVVMLVARDPGPGQAAAEGALVAFPPERVASIGVGPLSPTLLRLAAEMGDLRTLDAARAAMHAADPPTRAAALDALGTMGDARAIPDARTMLTDAERIVRTAAGRALVRLGAPDRFRAVEALIGNDETALGGFRLADLSADAGVARALAARVKASGDAEIRALAIAALGSSEADEAVEALAELAKDPVLEGDAAAALAKSPNPKSANALQSMVRTAEHRRLGARAYVLRAWVRGDRSEWGTKVLDLLGASPDPRDRAVGLAGQVLLGELDAARALEDKDASVRRAVATAATVDLHRAEGALLDLSQSEPDPLAQRVERGALVLLDHRGRLTTTLLADRASVGESDSALATMALAARADPDDRAEVDALLASPDPILRAHAARGLGASADADATGRLAHAFAFEVEPLVRRAIVLALALRTHEMQAPARLLVLKRAAHLDPDSAVRDTAARGLAGLPAVPRPARMDLAWLRLTRSTGQSPPSSSAGEGGVLLRSDGLAVPIAFDPEGYALVPIPPGEARLLLEPRIPAYDGTVP